MTQDAWHSLLDETAIPGLPQFNRATIAGISVAISGNILISLALNCQKLAHRRLEKERELNRVGTSNNNQNGIKPSLQDNSLQATESEENGALTPTGGILQLYNVSHPRETDGSSAAAVSETQPLLSPPERHDLPVRKRSLFKKIVSWSQRGEHVHIEPTQSLLPVDVITVRPSNASEEETSSKGGEEDNDVNESDYLKSKLWWLGFTLMNIGEMGNFISYAFAPASVVAPLGTFALIANCIFAPVMLKERFRKRDVFGVLVAIIGAVTVVLSANPSDTRLDPDSLIRAISQKVFIVFSAVYIVAALVLSSLSEGSIGQRHVFVDVGLCAIFGGFTVLSTKAISTLLTKEWLEMFTEWITYPVIAVLLGTGIGQIRYLNRALMRFDSKIVVPTQFVMFNLSAIVGSAILYGDFKSASFHQIVTFLYGCAATFAGVFIIAWTPREFGPDGDEGDVSMEDEEDLEAAIANREDTAISRDVRMGSLSRRDRPILVIPDSIAEGSAATPILRNKPSMANLIGLSPAQRVLLVHTPPRDSFVRSLSQESNDRDITHNQSRRRTISWMGEGSPAHRGGRRIRSNVGSREASLSRPSAFTSPHPRNDSLQSP